MMYALLSSGSSWIKEFFESFKTEILEEFKIGDIGEEINKGILQWQGYFSFGNKQVLLTDAIIVSWIAIAVCIVLCVLAIRKKSILPNKRQTLIEMVVDLIVTTSMNFGMNREQAEHVAPMVGTFGLVIMSCNVCSLFRISPPAKNVAFPIALAVFDIIYVIAVSIKMVGIKGFWKSLINPMPAMLPFKILDYIIKPVSLSLRLFGNVFGAFVFMEFLYICVPIFIPGIFCLWFDLADGILQALVFSYLTMSYIGEIVEAAHEDEGDKKKHGKNKEKSKDDVKVTDGAKLA